MELVPFIAHSAADAVAQIREQLGPDAVVTHVRPLPTSGLRRLLGKPRFEVLAYKPEPQAPRLDLRSDGPAVPLASPAPSTSPPDSPTPSAAPSDPNGWHIVRLLEGAGFSALNAQRVLDRLQKRFGTRAPQSVGEEIQATRDVLADLWRKPPETLDESIRPHVLVGAPGCGKTTSLTKWLTQLVLIQGRDALVWRLDGTTANTAEALDVHCQILGVPVERSWHVPPMQEDRIHFIDLPGIDWRSDTALNELGKQIRTYLTPHVHLVLNAAYEPAILLQQIRAFATLPVEDLILTHLDEEPRLGKAWNLILGTNFPIRFLSAGQNIPGEFVPATADRVSAKLLPMQVA